ncbi:hypothetical protein [Paracoccus aeridis]|uniref:hypothetical protein n=1 Tax=Paracoccus aeridis TaxID=1966466 RepID=UPI0010AB2598|nr:hypothetical protein [Paracoccus aeridis]
MKRGSLVAAAVLAASMAAMPALADPGHGNGHGNGKGHGHASGGKEKAGHVRHDDGRGRGHADHARTCPPGLAKKNPPCVPPGQARKHDDHHGTRVGDVLRVGDYAVIRDFDRYDLERRRGWDYYRDDDRVYRVDSDTRKILAVINLIDAFTN